MWHDRIRGCRASTKQARRRKLGLFSLSDHTHHTFFCTPNQCVPIFACVCMSTLTPSSPTKATSSASGIMPPPTRLPPASAAPLDTATMLYAYQATTAFELAVLGPLTVDSLILLTSTDT